MVSITCVSCQSFFCYNCSTDALKSREFSLVRCGRFVFVGLFFVFFVLSLSHMLYVVFLGYVVVVNVLVFPGYFNFYFVSS